MTDAPDDRPSRGDVAVDLYVRPAQLQEALEEYVATLNRLASEGVIGDVAIHSWPSRVPTRSPATDAVERFREFREWAAAHDASIQPPFSVRTVESELTGERSTYLSTPVMCLAVHDDDEVLGVYPHTTGEHHRTVADAIEALRAQEFGPREADGALPTRAGGNCSECGGSLVNVQGVPACHDCDWVDRPATARLTTATLR